MRERALRVGPALAPFLSEQTLMDEAAALHMIYGPDGLCLTGDLRACSPMTPVDWRRDHACHIYLMPRSFTVSGIKVSRSYDTKIVAGSRFSYVGIVVVLFWGSWFCVVSKGREKVCCCVWVSVCVCVCSCIVVSYVYIVFGFFFRLILCG